MFAPLKIDGSIIQILCYGREIVSGSICSCLDSLARAFLREFHDSRLDSRIILYKINAEMKYRSLTNNGLVEMPNEKFLKTLSFFLTKLNHGFGIRPLYTHFSWISILYYMYRTYSLCIKLIVFYSVVKTQRYWLAGAWGSMADIKIFWGSNMQTLKLLGVYD